MGKWAVAVERKRSSYIITALSFQEAARGRWVVMDAGDLDEDGDTDLVLGSFVYFLPAADTSGLGKKWLSSGPSIIVLENTIR